MIKGFKDFITRGNVIELAIAVVIGGAFGGVVTQLTKSFIEPLIKLMGGGGVGGGAFSINGVGFDWAAFINSIINFLIVAAVIYFLVVIPFKKLSERSQQKAEILVVAPEVPKEIALLEEIRDLLKKQSS
jgi:large conductance mechanosensitive channel